MITKQLRFDDDVLDILRSMDWQQDGLVGILTCGNLDRPMYLKVNKALAAMGGKWNRKLKGHLFPIDPRLTVTDLLEDGTLTIEKGGFFETPPAVVQKMLDLIIIDWENAILEPSAGLGAIADQLPIDREKIICIEKNPQRVDVLRSKGYYAICTDFLTFVGPQYNTIVMNPPFEVGQDILHVQHAYTLLALGGWLVSVMSEGPFFRSDKKATAFREWLEDVGAYSHKLEPGSFKESGTGVSARLLTIHKRRE